MLSTVPGGYTIHATAMYTAAEPHDMYLFSRTTKFPSCQQFEIVFE